jgi:uroporphyrinogen decarboxylase
MQTAREVIDSLVRGRSAERVGLWESVWPDTIRRWVAEGYPTDDAGEPVDPAEHFGHDIGGAGTWFDILPLRGYSEVMEETDEWEIRRNGAGAALKWWKHKSGTPEHIDFRMTSREIWESDYRPHLLELDRERVDIEGIAGRLARRRRTGHWAHYGHMFVFENMRQSMGDVCLYESVLLDPDWIHDYNRVYTDFFQAHFRLLFEEVGMPDGVWLYEDLGYKGSLFVSPKGLSELIFPYYREMVDFFHSYDLPVVLHSCGYVEEALPLVVEVGFDALNPMEVKAGCDALRFAEDYGDRLALVGGLDARVLESGDRELIRREVINLIEGMKERGARYVFGSDHSLSTNVAYDDYRYALEVYHDHMMY